MDRTSGRFFFSRLEKRAYVEHLHTSFAAGADNTILRADRVLEHRFDLLGSGLTDLGPEIDWHRDFKSGKVWPRVPFHRTQITDPADRSDIKVPWELSRLQCLTDLGRAYWLTNNEGYAQETCRLIDAWESKNPVDVGVNWACSMEVAIRAINLIWGAQFVADSPSTTELSVQRLIRLLYYHGRHIERNLEFISDGSNTNHLLADYLGLLYLSLIIPEYDRSDRWREISTRGLETEIRLQVLADGADYESSLPYHRLVLEMFLSAFLLGKKCGVTFSQEYANRLCKMVEFSATVTGASGLTPIVGDNDDGYIVKLRSDNPADHRPLVDIGSVLFDIAVQAPIQCTEERLWYLGPNAIGARTKRLKDSPVWHRHSGYIVIKNGEAMLTMNAGGIPDRQFGGHKHNDLLAVTLELDGAQVLVDAGTACYTADYAARNRSRSTAMHNTVMVDGEEQQRFFPDRLFYMRQDARPHVELFSSAGMVAIASAAHDGYQRLGVIHRRTLWFSPTELMLAIRDEFDGDPTICHDFRAQYLTPQTVRVAEDGTSVQIGISTDSPFVLSFGLKAGGRLHTEHCMWHPRYDAPEPATQVCYNFSAHAPCYLDTLMTYGSPDLVGSTLERYLERVGFSIHPQTAGVLI